MRIFHLITTIEAGGAENQLLVLCKEQRTLGYQIDLFFFKGRPELLEQFSKLGVNVHNFSDYSSLQSISYLKRKARVLKPDLIHSHLPRAELFSICLRRLSIIVVTRHNAEPFWPRGPRLFSVLLSRLVLKRAKTCICISETVARFLRQNYEASRKTNLVVVKYGIAQTNEGIKRKSFELNQGRILKILCVARLEPQKDLKTLLKGFSLIVNGNINSELTIAGSGSLELSLKSYAEELGIGNRINWVGKVMDVASLYQNHDLFILTSSYEGFGMVYLEALNAGIPIITSNNSAAKEIFGPNYPGLFELESPENLASCFRKTYPFQLENWLLEHREPTLTKYSATSMANHMHQAYLSLIE